MVENGEENLWNIVAIIGKHWL